jgi:hypothetical protein
MPFAHQDKNTLFGIMLNGVTSFGVCAAWNKDAMAFSIDSEQIGLTKVSAVIIINRKTILTRSNRNSTLAKL